MLRFDDRSPDARTINVCIAPYGDVAAVDDGAGPYMEKFLSGAFREEVEEARTAPLRIWLNLVHRKENVVGHATGLTELDGGLYGAFAVRPGIGGDKVLAAIRDGALTGVSMQATPLRSRDVDGVTVRGKAHLTGVALVPDPAYRSANVAPEGNASTTLSFPVTLSASSLLPVSVSYATTAGTATAGTDFTAANGTLAFKPGETTKTITVTVVGDTVYEPSETFTVALSNPVNTTIGTGSATGTIQNDDPVAQPGHYTGRDSQNEVWNFDVTPDGKGLANLTTGQMNMSCSYAGQTIGSTYGGNVHLTSTIPIAQNGSFSTTVNFNGGTISG